MSAIQARPARRVLIAGSVLIAATVAAFSTGAQGSSPSRKTAPAPRQELRPAVSTRADRALAKIEPSLRATATSGSAKQVAIYATIRGTGKQAKAMVSRGHIARYGKAALLVGKIRANQLTKFASLRSVMAVHMVDLHQTGRPLGSGDPDLAHRVRPGALRSAVAAMRHREVDFHRAPAIRESRWQRTARLNLLDARTHNFSGAWKDGITGRGTTVAVLDGGTDFGHPDLLGTWRNGSDGWPMAFDPFGTLQWLSAPSQITDGLSWYTLADLHSDLTRVGHTYQVDFDVRTGPSRNFAAPDGFNTHTYTFPARWTKSGVVRLGNHPDDYLLAGYGERVAYLVTDPHHAGVYDTIYVDLNDDYDFSDEKPVTRSSPVAYRDLDGDGVTDLSGGLVYYISDGTTGTPVKGGLTDFGVELTANSGRIVAWSGDFDTGIEGHGTLTASNVVGQAVINGLAPTFTDVHGGTYPGAVLGGAPDARLAPFGDIYFAFPFSTQFGYILAAENGVDVTSNSYGESANDNDGYDAASQEADFWQLAFGAQMTQLFSTGNGAPGFGTTTSPRPFTGIGVGASTQFGGTGWDSITRASQIVDNDVMVWSNRGPGMTGSTGVDIVADGAFSSGDLTLNAAGGDGNYAWETWGGTSRSTPVAAGATALVYQAYRKAHAGAAPDAFTARDILKSSANDLGYESWIQGAGSVDAGRAVQAAEDDAAVASPTEWRPGDYHGSTYDVFTHLMAPGATSSTHFAISGGERWNVSSRQLVRTDSVTRSFTSSDVADEGEYNFNAPDYLMDVTDLVRAHRDADLMVVRANFDLGALDANGDYNEDQAWRLLTYSWTDVNHDGRLWTDADGDGAVDHTDLTTSSNIDAFPDIDFANAEIEKGEYVRFMYHRPGANTLQSWVRSPGKRMGSGVFIGLQHSGRDDTKPTTSMQIRIDFYKNQPWSWVSTPASARGGFDAAMSVPADAPVGMYDGGVVLERHGRKIVIPVSVTVGATVPQAADGSIDGTLTLGGADVAEAQKDLLYSNGSVFGATDWTWRAESGDWRFFYLDVLQAPPPGSLFLSDTTWDDAAPGTDLDTVVFGPSANTYQLAPDGPVGGPYILDTVGKSTNTNVGNGVWLFDTSTGGNEELVAAPAQEGLHAVAQHQVLFQGDRFDVPFSTTVGGANVSPAAVDVTTTTDTAAFDVTFKASLDLPGLVSEGFGVSQPAVYPETGVQDDANDPTTASVKQDFALTHASTVTISTDLGSDDIDLYVLYDVNGDGSFTTDEIVGASAGGTGVESVTLRRPPDGNYQVWVHGFAVAGSPAYNLTVDAVQGNDLTVSGLPAGAVPAGTAVTLHVDVAHAMTAGETYFGELQLGPPSSPGAISVPVTITRN